jgi:hypothetical protein
VHIQPRLIHRNQHLNPISKVDLLTFLKADTLGARESGSVRAVRFDVFYGVAEVEEAPGVRIQLAGSD